MRTRRFMTLMGAALVLSVLALSVVRALEEEAERPFIPWKNARRQMGGEAAGRPELAPFQAPAAPAQFRPGALITPASLGRAAPMTNTNPVGAPGAATIQQAARASVPFAGRPVQNVKIGAPFTADAEAIALAKAAQQQAAARPSGR